MSSLRAVSLVQLSKELVVAELEHLASFFRRLRGVPESIRQNSLFKDFFLLAESESEKRKYLYVLDTKFPLKFLSAGRALSSVLSKDQRVRDQFHAKFGDRFHHMREYFLVHRDKVVIADVSAWVPDLIADDFDEEE